MVDESLLREPADRCVRLVALSLLADAQKAGDRLTSVAVPTRRSPRRATSTRWRIARALPRSVSAI